MKIYAYCLAPEMDVSILASIQGIAAARPGFIDCGGINAVFSELNTPFVTATRENILAHQHVVAAVMEDVTPLPFRFGMLASPAGLKNYIESNQASLTQLLRHVSRCVQMNVKIRVGTGPSSHPRPSEEKLEAAQESGPGTRFLVRKQQEHGSEAANTRLAREVADWISALLSQMAKDSRVSTHLNASLVVARFLIPREKTGEFAAAVEVARQSRPELPFMRSGPWPPYHFAQLGP